MPTLTSSQMDTPARRPARLLLGLTGALLSLLILLLAVLLVAALVAFKHRSAARVAVVVAWIEIAAFAFFHVIPVEVGPSKPYWGEGMGDALQWVGLLSILAVSAAILRVARRASKATVTPAAASVS